MLSGSPTVMPSCYRDSRLSSRKESGNALLFCYLASRLVFPDSLPSSLFIPSESIRSLSNSLPVLARTGFENHVPVEAGSLFLENKGFLSRGRPQELPKSSEDPSKNPPRGPKSCQRRSKRTPKTLQEHQKRSHSLIVSLSYRFIVSCFHSLIVP